MMQPRIIGVLSSGWLVVQVDELRAVTANPSRKFRTGPITLLGISAHATWTAREDDPKLVREIMETYDTPETLREPRESVMRPFRPVEAPKHVGSQWPTLNTDDMQRIITEVVMGIPAPENESSERHDYREQVRQSKRIADAHGMTLEPVSEWPSADLPPSGVTTSKLKYPTLTTEEQNRITRDVMLGVEPPAEETEEAKAFRSAIAAEWEVTRRNGGTFDLEFDL